MTQKNNQPHLFMGGVDASEALTGLPAVPPTGVVVSTDKALAVREMHLVVTDLEAEVLAANDYGSAKLCDLPDKNLLLLSVEVNLVGLKSGGIIAGTDLDLAVGSAAASAQTLATTMIDIVEKSDHDASEASATWQAHTADQATAAYPLQKVDSATSALYLNVGLPVGVADGAVTFTGTVVLKYVDLGNEIS
jgi:hypothetical protein